MSLPVFGFSEHFDVKSILPLSISSNNVMKTKFHTSRNGAHNSSTY